MELGMMASKEVLTQPLFYEGKWKLIYTKCEELEGWGFFFQKFLLRLKQMSGIFMTGLKTALRGSDKALLEQKMQVPVQYGILIPWSGRVTFPERNI